MFDRSRELFSAKLNLFTIIRNFYYNNNTIDPKDNIKWPLLFDPQTSGGLLAAIPEKDVYLVTNELKKYGFMNEIIGEFFAGTPEIRVT